VSADKLTARQCSFRDNSAGKCARGWWLLRGLRAFTATWQRP
jgi:hypothetical protein